MLVFWAAMHVNSIFLLLLGLPFDRALPWHKALALLTLANSILHGITFYISPRGRAIQQTREHLLLTTGDAIHMEETGVHSFPAAVMCLCAPPGARCSRRHNAAAPRAGWFLLVAIIIMIGTALPWALKRSFSSFFKVHVTLAFVSGFLTIWHGFGQASLANTAESIPGTFIWLVDLFLRFLTVNRARHLPVFARCLFVSGNVVARFDRAYRLWRAS